MKLKNSPDKFNAAAIYDALAVLLSTQRGETARQGGLLHPALKYSHEFATSVNSRRSLSPLMAALYTLNAAMSAFADFHGFLSFFPGQPVAALLLAIVLEGTVVLTGLLYRRATRRAMLPLIAMMVLFPAFSVVISVGAITGGERQTRQDRDRPAAEHEDAVRAEGTFSASAASTQRAVLGRIVNEVNFMAKAPNLNTYPRRAVSGFTRSREQRRDALGDLKARWAKFDFSEGSNGARITGEIWAALRGRYGEIMPLVAETEKLTSGGASIPTPAYPVPPDHRAADARRGITDQTGVIALLHPTPFWILAVPLSVMLDFGPLLIAATLRRIDEGDEMPQEETADDGSEPYPIKETQTTLWDDWAERERSIRRVGDDPKLEPLADACSAEIRDEVQSMRAVEVSALASLVVMREMEVAGERLLILRDSAAQIGMEPKAVKSLADQIFVDLVDRLDEKRQAEKERRSLDGERTRAEWRLRAKQQVLALATQIAQIEAEIDTLGNKV